jgi:hypothetical protein
MRTLTGILAALAVAALSALAALMHQPVAQAQPSTQSTQSTPVANVRPRARLPIVMRARATPTPAPRCAGSQPNVLPAWLVYEARYSGLYGVGELCNPLDRAVYIDYAFEALDGQGNIIETISQSGWRPVPPRGVMCVESVFSNKPAAARYQFRVRGWRDASSFLGYGGTLQGSSYDPSEHTVTGTVRNQTGKEVYVGMAVALYDAGGQILQCDEFPTVNDSSLDPGQTTSFRSRFYDYDPVVAALLQRVTQHAVVLSQTP